MRALVLLTVALVVRESVGAALREQPITLDAASGSHTMKAHGSPQAKKADVGEGGQQAPAVAGAQVEPQLVAVDGVSTANSTQTKGFLTGQNIFEVKDFLGMLEMSAATATVMTTPQADTDMCGNGIRQGEEQCDDGNLVDGDGCSKMCRVEGGYACEVKMVDDIGDRCHLCKDDQCTLFVFGSSRCARTTKSNITKETKTPPLHVRQVNGFCGCAPNHCMDIDGPMCREEKDGWTGHETTGLCECGLGHCLMPMASQVISSPSKYHCQRETKVLVRNATTGMCQCAAGTPAIASTDPAEASPATLDACKVYPSTPVKKIALQGPLYPEFSCMGTPYMKLNTSDSDVCTNCTDGACRMPRTGVSASKRNLGAEQPNQFYCVDTAVQEMMKMTRDNATGSCQCSETECLVPYRDTMKCVPIKGSHPYGDVKLLDGKCGCANDADACIMPNSPAGFGKPSEGFMCLRLKEGAEPTQYGKKYYRGKTGYCRCKANFCRADPTPESVGQFRCVDVESQGAYKQNDAVVAAIKAGTSTEEDVPCTCADGACMLPGDTGNTARCVTCPTASGDCVSGCSSDASANIETISCIKYCSTKHVKLEPAVGKGYGELFDKKNYAARVIKCFISKTLTCEEVPEGKQCTSTVTARAVYDCPGVWSKRSTRKLADGTDTNGFKSVCSSNNYQCQLERCNSVANPAVCLQGMVQT